MGKSMCLPSTDEDVGLPLHKKQRGLRPEILL